MESDATQAHDCRLIYIGHKYSLLPDLQCSVGPDRAPPSSRVIPDQCPTRFNGRVEQYGTHTHAVIRFPPKMPYVWRTDAFPVNGAVYIFFLKYNIWTGGNPSFR